ncbi:FAD-dependent oxidoreductase [Candidatus Daviesbacteria bacterium]|nr:FAD-dependent oxidoreductase [Candidatus Daviesbacteria bacterium]
MINRKVAILGGGFTGLTAAFKLLKKGYQVTIFEKENDIGGLAKGFKLFDWEWALEKSYHHWFTNDSTILHLAKEIDHKVHIIRPRTDVYINGKLYPFDSVFSLLFFRSLSFIERLRVGFFSLYLKLISNPSIFERKTALTWIKQFMGHKATKLIWDPLFSAKFGSYKNRISLVWFWARIKKRTFSLAYPEGGFKAFADHLNQRIKKLGGEVKLNSQVTGLKSLKSGILIITSGKSFKFDEAIVTLPSPVFSKIAQGLPKNYIKRINSVKHLHAQVLVLILKKQFMKKTYWLNITDKKFPFLVLVEHTNFINKKFYSDKHILYVGNYLHPDHPNLSLNAGSLLKKFDPYLKKINPDYRQNILSYKLFIDPYAQPVFTTDYPKKIPIFQTPLKGIYISNLDMVYPWDRGTNYAVELGEKIVDVMEQP